MNGTSFPTEIFATIFEEFISAHTIRAHWIEDDISLTPRWYLTPLRRVSKKWYAIGVKYLYQSIAMGSSGPQAAEALRSTLEANSQLAAFVKRIQLGIEASRRRTGWSGTNTGLLRLCPNVVHIEIHGFDDLDYIIRALRKKSLVSFSISTLCLSHTGYCRTGMLSQIFSLMQNWPKLRSIEVDGFYEDAEEIPLDVSHPCSNLREISISHTAIHPPSYAALRAMCSSGVTKLSVKLSNKTTHELCEYLRTWFATLEVFRVNITDVDPSSYQSLNEAMGTLTKLRVLGFNGAGLDYGVISRLPCLEQIYCYPDP